MIEINNEKIWIDQKYSILRYNTKECIYRIKLYKSFARKEFSPIVYIEYTKSLYNRKFLSTHKDIIPNKHREIVSQLCSIYEDNIILPMKMTENINYKNELVF